MSEQVIQRRVGGSVVLLCVGIVAGLAVAHILRAWPGPSALWNDEPEGRDIRHFVEFIKVRTDSDRVFITGRQFATRFERHPESQWCYVNGGDLGGAKIHIGLAEQEGSGPVKYGAVTEEAAAEIYMDRRELEAAAREHCRITEAVTKE